MKKDIKEVIHNLIEAYSKVEGVSGKRMILSEIKKFVSFIIASNASISSEEPEFLGNLLDREISADELANYISAENIQSKDFSKTPQSLFKKYVQNVDLSTEYVKAFVDIGKEAIICDNKADQSEVDALTGYVNMLCEYFVNENPDEQYDFIKTIEAYLDDNGEIVSPDGETLEELLVKLDALIGLNSVKKNVYSLLHLQNIQMEREKRGLAKIPMSNHLVFTGNPGTGKTTVARLIARIYNKIGLLSSGNFVEVDRSGMVAGYVGQTAIEVKNVMDTAKGGVLFIDEAYSLANGLQGDYGMEAIETLLKRMEDDREDLVVIVAGYPELMERFISSNPGLRSRFSKKIHFPDYDPEELLQILEYMIGQQKFTISDEAVEYAYKLLEKKYNERTENFANAREVRNLFEAAVVSQADRLYGKEELSDEELCRLEIDDFKFNGLVIE